MMKTFEGELKDIGLAGLEPAIRANDYITGFGLQNSSLSDANESAENERAIMLARTILNAALIIAWSNKSK